MSFQPPSWGKALMWKTGIFLHHFSFSMFLVLRKHLVFQSSTVFPWNDTTQLWLHWGKKRSSGISLQIPWSNLPFEGQLTNISLTWNQKFQFRSTVPKLSKSSSQTKAFCFIFLGRKKSLTICIFLWNLFSWENCFSKLNLSKSILVGNSLLSLLLSAPATHASCLPYGNKATVKQATSWDRRCLSAIGSLWKFHYMETLWSKVTQECILNNIDKIVYNIDKIQTTTCKLLVYLWARHFISSILILEL